MLGWVVSSPSLGGFHVASLLTSLMLVLSVGPLGSISGRVVLVGEAPAAAEIDPGSDACCVKAAPKSEHCVVGPDRGLANVVVTLRPTTSLPSADLPTEAVEMHNLGCAFVPRVAVVRVGQSFAMVNSDPTTHNMNATLRRNGAFNLVLPPEDRREIVFEQAESKPLAISCNVHPFMRGYLYVVDHPHVVVTDESGRFAFDAVPSGEVACRFWHEGKRLAGASIDDRKTDRRGEAMLSLEPEEHLDLGEVEVRLVQAP